MKEPELILHYASSHQCQLKEKEDDAKNFKVASQVEGAINSTEIPSSKSPSSVISNLQDK